MNYDDFIKKYKNKTIDYDGVAGVQCVDLVKQYLHDVFGISPGSWGDAHCYFDEFSAHKELSEYFIKIKNAPDLVPQKGDICVWKAGLNKGGWGHIAIATGEGDTTYFYSYDQNWSGKHDPVTRVRHNYSHFAGVLRPKDRSKSASAFKAGDYTLLVNVKVRTGAGTTYRQKKRSELTADGQKHALSQEMAVLKKGTAVTVKEIKTVSENVWGRIPSGWIALRYQGEKYVK